MIPGVQQLLEQCPTHLHTPGEEGDCANTETRYQVVHCAQGPDAPSILQEAGELRRKVVIHTRPPRSGQPVCCHHSQAPERIRQPSQSAPYGTLPGQ